MTCEIPQWGSRAWVDFVRDNNAAFDSLPNNTFTQDGLIKCSDLIRVPDEYSYQLWLRQYDHIAVYANHHASSVADYLAADPTLWDFGAIRVVSGIGAHGRAPIFGVPFQKAVEIAMQRGFVKSEFYLPNQRDDVFYATLLLHVNRRKGSNRSTIELQAWQYVPGLSEVFYVHAESPDFIATVNHLDGAIIYFHPDDIARLFTICDKIKGNIYEKQFRLDGSIPVGDMFNIISAYLPVTELVDEVFACSQSAA